MYCIRIKNSIQMLCSNLGLGKQLFPVLIKCNGNDFRSLVPTDPPSPQLTNSINQIHPKKDKCSEVGSTLILPSSNPGVILNFPTFRSLLFHLSPLNGVVPGILKLQ